MLPDFKERFNYLKIGGPIGIDTFGPNRYLNQEFYTSKEWRRFRREIILRDDGCDLGLLPLGDKAELVIHHLEPITVDDVIERNLEKLLNPENAITVRALTHKAIHYGSSRFLFFEIEGRKPYDTVPWR